MTEIIEQLTGALTERGWRITVVDVAPLKARFLATDPATDATCEVDLLKEVLWRPPVVMDIGPVLDLNDLIGTKVRALGDRGLARDAIDVHAARHLYSLAELEALAARRPDEFDLTELHDRLESLEWISDAEFEAYGMDSARITQLRQLAQQWLTTSPSAPPSPTTNPPTRNHAQAPQGARRRRCRQHTAAPRPGTAPPASRSDAREESGPPNSSRLPGPISRRFLPPRQGLPSNPQPVQLVHEQNSHLQGARTLSSAKRRQRSQTTDHPHSTRR